MLKFHSISVEELLNILNSNLNGLSNQEALKRLEATGKNIIPEEKISVFRIFLKNIKNVFNFVLFFALILTLVLNKYTDSFF
ncbi:MAG: cation-transporting P-type ATPase [Patescibacteria group bacterium]|nr:cation-transporting P-type ATPase [Patescibacteria group bacterium]